MRGRNDQQPETGPSTVRSLPAANAADAAAPGLWWPLLLIIGPLVLLAGLAAWTLHLDRRSAEQEAQTRAAELGAVVLSAAEASLEPLPRVAADRRAPARCLPAGRCRQAGNGLVCPAQAHRHRHLPSVVLAAPGQFLLGASRTPQCFGDKALGFGLRIPLCGTAWLA